MSNKFKSEMLWAAAYELGGELRISKETMAKAAKHGPVVIMTDDHNNNEYVIKAVHPSSIDPWKRKGKPNVNSN